MTTEHIYKEARELAKKIVADSIQNETAAVQIITNVLCEAYEDKVRAVGAAWDTCEAVCGSNDINPCYVMDRRAEYLQAIPLITPHS